MEFTGPHGLTEWPFEDSQFQLNGNVMWGQGNAPQASIRALNQCPNTHMCVSSVARIP